MFFFFISLITFKKESNRSIKICIFTKPTRLIQAKLNEKKVSKGKNLQCEIINKTRFALNSSFKFIPEYFCSEKQQVLKRIEPTDEWKEKTYSPMTNTSYHPTIQSKT